MSAKLEDAPALAQRLRATANACGLDRLGLATLLVMAAEMISHLYRLLTKEQA